MIIPEHIWKLAEDIKYELERQLEDGGNVAAVKNSLNVINNVRKAMLKQNEKYIENEDDYINMLEFVEAMIRASDALWVPALKRIYEEVEIEPELVYALNHARIVHPRMRKEIDSVIAFLEEVPNCIWSQDDECADFRVFKFVKTKRKWERIMEKFSGTDLGSRSLKYLRIGYVENETGLYAVEGIAKKAKEHLEEKLGKDGFYAMRKPFKKWFRIGRTGTYYIYVPK